MYGKIEVRVVREEQLGGEWADIEPLTFMALTERVAELIAGQIAQAEEVYMVRWNWGGQVAGLGQGHYIHGPALKRRYRLGSEQRAERRAEIAAEEQADQEAEQYRRWENHGLDPRDPGWEKADLDSSIEREGRAP